MEQEGDIGKMKNVGRKNIPKKKEQCTQKVFFLFFLLKKKLALQIDLYNMPRTAGWGSSSSGSADSGLDSASCASVCFPSTSAPSLPVLQCIMFMFVYVWKIEGWGSGEGLGFCSRKSNMKLSHFRVCVITEIEFSASPHSANE